VYSDFSKAFDKVNHSILIQKLSDYGVTGTMLLWFTSYLTDRTQVKIFYSKCTIRRPSRLGLSPLLFSIFINDIGLNFRSLHCLFADDLKLYRIIRYQIDMVELQLDLND
jgi:hypothetical protein